MVLKNEGELSIFEEEESKRQSDIFQNRVLVELGSFGAALISKAVKAALSQPTQSARVDSVNQDVELNVAISNFRANAMATTLKVLDDAMWKGYTTDLGGRSEITRRQPGTFNFTLRLDDTDRQALSEWPIFGHTRLEIATNLVEGMLFKVNNLIASPLRRDFDVDAIPQELELLRNQFAKDVAVQSQQAYLTGAQASTQQVKSAANAVKQV